MSQRNPLKKAVNHIKQFKRWHSGASDCLPDMLKQKKIKSLAKHYKLTRMIETGTYLGDMVNATKDAFERIDSIELDPTLHANAVKRFAGIPHVTIWQGDSATTLSKLLEQNARPTLFWLDAHYSGGKTAKSELGDTPIEAELALIFKTWKPSDIIAIDDARLFDGTNNYPTFDNLRETLKAADLNLASTVDSDIIIIKDALR